MRTILIEDEIGPLKTLKSQLERCCPELTVLGEAMSVKKGVDLIRQFEPELVFLDIQLTDGTGFDLIDRLKELSFHIVFVTAYEKFAVKAFEYNALHYLLKPLLEDDLKSVIQRIGDSEKTKPDFRIASKSFRERKWDRIAIRSVSTISYVYIKELIRLESEGAYTNIFLKSGKKILSTKSLKFYDQLLSQNRFYRIHRSHLINLEEVSEYKKGESDKVILMDGSCIEISRKKRKEFLKAME